MNHIAIFAALACLGLSGCSLTATQIASVSCAGAEAGATVAVSVTTDAAGATDAANAAKVANAVHRACPAIVAGVAAMSAAAAAK